LEVSNGVARKIDALCASPPLITDILCALAATP
jgi:hypothetical protein